MEKLYNDFISGCIKWCSIYALEISIIVLVIFIIYYITHRHNKIKRINESDFINFEDSVIGLHDSNCKRIKRLEKQVKIMHTDIINKNNHILKLEREIDSLRR